MVRTDIDAHHGRGGVNNACPITRTAESLCPGKRKDVALAQLGRKGKFKLN